MAAAASAGSAPRIFRAISKAFRAEPRVRLSATSQTQKARGVPRLLLDLPDVDLVLAGDRDGRGRASLAEGCQF